MTYADVDRSGDPAGAAAWMDEMATWPDVRACKARTIGLLAGRAPVVDLGCGTGDDVRALGRAAVGLDASTTMLREARRRGGAFVRADVHALPFPDGSLGGVRTERVLQHVAAPDAVLRELARVVRPGGVAVLAEPDQSTLVIEGADEELTPAIVAFRTASVRNGVLAAELDARLTNLGFRDVGREAFPLTVTDPDLAFGLPSWPAMLVARGEWDEEAAERFRASLSSPSFRYRVDIVVTWGTR